MRIKANFTALLIAVLFLGESLLFAQQPGFGIGNRRYPILVEHELMKSCIVGDGRARDYQMQDHLIEECGCRIGEAQRQVKYKEYQNEPERFKEAFQKAVETCETKKSRINAKVYPIAVQYELMAMCVTGDRRWRYRYERDGIKKQCACQIERTKKKCRTKCIGISPKSLSKR